MMILPVMFVYVIMGTSSIMMYCTLTPVEAERIQGFRDNWTNTGMPEKFRFFCMGNALVVPMITRMGRRLGAIMEAEPEPVR